MPATLCRLFYDQVHATPTAPFLADEQQALSYEAAYEIACRRAAFLTQAKVRRGDRILIIDGDSLQTALWVLTCILNGLVFAVLHKSTSPTRLRMLIDDAEPTGLIDPDPLARRPVYESLGTHPFVIHHPDDLEQLPVQTPIGLSALIETDLVCLVYTSGSTKNPRAIMCPNRSVLAAVTAINQYLQHRPVDRIGHILPLSFDYGLYQLFLAMHAGSSVDFLGEFRSPLLLMTQLRTRGITGFPALRSLLVPLARLNAAACQTDILRYISNTGDHLPPSLIRKLMTNFPNTNIFSMYGLSECKRALYMPPERLATKPESVGQAIPGTRAYVIDEQGACVPPGQVGELMVEGPHVMNGYWRSPEESAERFSYGPYGEPRLRTGDLFYQDADGDFYFVSRKTDLIKSRGFRISPREVEAAILAADPAVAECIIYAEEDELLGQAVIAAVIVADDAHTVEQIFMRCRASMDAHLVPTRIHIVTAFSQTSSGKYARREPARRSP